MGYRLDGNNVHVKTKNFTISVRNDSGRLETLLSSLFGDANESGGQTLAGVWENRKAVASCGFKNQFVFHGCTLAVRDDVGKDFFRIYDGIVVEFVHFAPIRVFVHKLPNPIEAVIQGNLNLDNIVDVNLGLDFYFHA